MRALLLLLLIACGTAQGPCGAAEVCPSAQSSWQDAGVLTCIACDTVSMSVDLGKLAQEGKTCADAAAIYQGFAAYCPPPCGACR